MGTPTLRARKPDARALHRPVRTSAWRHDLTGRLSLFLSCFCGDRHFVAAAPAVYYNRCCFRRLSGAEIMAITIQAVYENGVLKPLGALYLREQQQVQITLEEPVDWVYRTRGIIPCADEALIQSAAMDPDLEYDFGTEP
jgi:predicted DNA-binding antitoxin AbrB/MazE fold protein